MARHRIKKYSRRTRSQYRKSHMPLVLAVIAFLLLTVIISVSIGIALSRRVEQSGQPQKKFDFERIDYSSGDKIVSAVEAYNLSKGANPSDYVAQGISDISVCVRHSDGKLGFRFEAAEYYSIDTQGEASFASVCNSAHQSGGRICAYMYLTSFAIEDKHLRGIAKAYELALIDELGRSGADDILILGLTVTDDNIDEVEDFVARASLAAGKAPLGVSVDEEMLAMVSDGVYLAPRLREVCDYLALDLTALTDGSVTDDKLEEALENNKYYIKSYPLRMLFATGCSGLYSKALAFGVTDMQVVGK